MTLCSGCTEPVVARSAGGHVYGGRFINARAYEAYARGALEEAEGRYDDAARSFRTAVESDEEGPEPWTRLGAVLCHQGDLIAATDAFEQAVSVDATFAGAHREWARCLLAKRQPKDALLQAELAFLLAPDDASTVDIYVEALDAANQQMVAARLLVARLLEQRPRRADAERLAKLRGVLEDELLGPFARALLEATAPEVGQRVDLEAKPSVPDRGSMDAALSRGDLAGARRMATRAKVSQGEIALRAAAMGRLSEAREQAELVLGADPADVNAAVALLAATDERDPIALGRAANMLRDARGRLGPLARLLFSELLLRHAGKEAALALLAGEDLSKPRPDPLEESCRARLARSLGP